MHLKTSENDKGIICVCVYIFIMHAIHDRNLHSLKESLYSHFTALSNEACVVMYFMLNMISLHIPLNGLSCHQP